LTLVYALVIEYIIFFIFLHNGIMNNDITNIRTETNLILPLDGVSPREAQKLIALVLKKVPEYKDRILFKLNSLAAEV